MKPVHLASNAKPVSRPGCTGMSAATIAHSEMWDAVALYFSENATSDDHTAPFDQWLVITQGSGWLSLGTETTAVRADDSVELPADVFHRFWTEGDTMDAVALAFDKKRGAELVRVPDGGAVARNAAERFVQLAARATADHGLFAAALSGGSTPRDLYTVLASPEFTNRVDWARVHFFWGDERAVPPNDPASNYRMAVETLLARVPVPPQNIHRIMGEQDPQVAAREYEQTLRAFFPSAKQAGTGRGNEFPRFDLILLGLGENGHTASLFPHARLLENRSDWVAAEYIAEVKMNRITLTAPLVNAAANVLFLVTGAGKAATVRAVLRGDYRPADLPAQLIRPVTGNLVWLLDRDAASAL